MDNIDNMDNEHKCIICHTSNNLIKYTHKCGNYIIHQECLDVWSSQSNTCFLCREYIEIDKPIIHIDSDLIESIKTVIEPVIEPVICNANWRNWCCIFWVSTIIALFCLSWVLFPLWVYINFHLLENVELTNSTYNMAPSNKSHINQTNLFN